MGRHNNESVSPDHTFMHLIALANRLRCFYPLI